MWQYCKSNISNLNVSIPVFAYIHMFLFTFSKTKNICISTRFFEVQLGATPRKMTSTDEKVDALPNILITGKNFIFQRIKNSLK